MDFVVLNVDNKGSFTIVNIYLLVQRVLNKGEGGGLRPASVLLKNVFIYLWNIL